MVECSKASLATTMPCWDKNKAVMFFDSVYMPFSTPNTHPMNLCIKLYYSMAIHAFPFDTKTTITSKRMKSAQANTTIYKLLNEGGKKNEQFFLVRYLTIPDHVLWFNLISNGAQSSNINTCWELRNCRHPNNKLQWRKRSTSIKRYLWLYW